MIIIKKLLITGFDPFGGESVNPAWEAVKRLPDVIGDYELHKMMIPTVFTKAAACVVSEAEIINPDIILCIGQAGGRDKITPEYVAINLKKARIPDNEGNMPMYEQILAGGPDGLFSTVDTTKLATKISEKYPAEVSLTAGAFVCNDTLYSLLHKYYGTDVKVGFIHVPYIPEQAVNGEPSMPLEDIIGALTIAVENV